MRTILCLVILGAVGIFANKNPEEGNMVEGDMEMNPEQMSAYFEQMGKDIGSDNNAFASIKSTLWLTNGKAGTIKYYIDPQIRAAKDVIKEAIGDYHRHTCIKFQESTSRPSGPHIFFTSGYGCSSLVGQSPYGNSIRLAPACWRKGIIMHEIGHSIGLFHEQSRPDRDEFVDIKWENIVEGVEINFKKMKTSNWDPHNTMYDYDSIMHYPSTAFTKNGKITIKTKNPNNQKRLGNRRGFSEIDIVQINKMYRCGGSPGGSCKDERTNCQENIKGCREWGKGWVDWMKKYCRKTCNFC